MAYFRVNLIHLVQNKDEAIVDSILQWDVLKLMRQIKNHDSMFRAIRALKVHKILKTRILTL